MVINRNSLFLINFFEEQNEQKRTRKTTTS